MNLGKLGLAALGVASVGVVPAYGQSAVAVERSGRTLHAAVCARGNPHDTARCFAHVVTDARGNPLNGKVTPNAVPSGYGAGDLQAAYSIPAGTGTPTIAI